MQLAEELIRAIEAKDVARSLALIEAGADYNAEPYALVKSSRTDKTLAVTKKLLERGAGEVRVLGAWLMATHALTNACDNAGHTAQTVDALIAHGADVNGTSPDHSRSLVAFLATCRSCLEASALPAVAALLRAGANVDGTFEPGDDARRTALGHAMFYHADDIGVLLLDNGADINARDSRGRSVLDLAKAAGLLTSSVPKTLRRLRTMGAV